MTNPFDPSGKSNEPQNPFGGEGYGQGQPSSYPSYPNGPQDNYSGGNAQPYGTADQYNSGYQYGGQFAGGQQSFDPQASHGAAGTFDALDSLGQAWKIFCEKPLSWILASVIYYALYTVIFLGGFLPLIVWSSANTDPYGELEGDMPPGIILLAVVAAIIAIVVLVLFQLVFTRSAVESVQGLKPSIKDFFTFRRVGAILVTVVVAGLLQMLGLIALIIGAFVVAFFLMFAPYAAVPEGQTVGGALRASKDTVLRNVGQSLILVLIIFGLSLVASLTGVATIVTTPLTMIMLAHAYLTANNLNVQRRA